MTPAPSRMLFVNIPVADLGRAVDFFTALGFTFNPQFTDESATCMIIGEQAFAMLLVDRRFRDFTSKQLCDTATHIEAILAVSARSREEVDSIADTALASGGTPAQPPADHGFMYYRSFHDPDGHMWEVLWMDPAAMEG